jgi:receptor protein-tyrosine kinase
MSLMDQAAKRLEELRRAGAAPTNEVVDGVQQPVPTPEAFVRALDSRKDPHADIWSATAKGAAPPPMRVAAAVGEAAVAGADSKPVVRTSPLVSIDLERLKARGFVTPDAPTVQVADEFRVIKRPIIRNAKGRGGASVRNGNLVMVTSALPAEGKTFTAVNLAMSIAMEYDNTVLLVDGDVAHPSLPRLLGIPESRGLLDLLTNDGLDVGDVLLKTNVEKLTLMQAGTAHRRATELLASEQMASLLHELGSRYPDRIVVFDSPPLLATTEARVMATHMGQILMVVAAEATSQNVVNHALSTIESCEVVLMMLNKASPTAAGVYEYYREDVGS